MRIPLALLLLLAPGGGRTTALLHPGSESRHRYGGSPSAEEAWPQAVAHRPIEHTVATLASDPASVRAAGARPCHVVDVRSFGADGEDGRDDTRALQAAIDSACEGAVIDVPAGVYSFSSLLVKDKKNLTITGRGATLRALGPGSLPLVNGLSPAHLLVTDSTGVRFEGFSVDGRRQPGNLVAFIRCVDCSIASLDLFHGGAQALFITAETTRFRATLSKFHGSMAGYGAFFGNLYSDSALDVDLLVEGCEFFDNHTGGVSVTARGARILGNLIASNGITSRAGSGVIINGALGRASRDVALSGNVITANAWHGIQSDVIDSGDLRNLPVHIAIANNIIARNGKTGIAIFAGSAWSVAGNHLYDNGDAGVYLERGADVSIVGNVIRDTRPRDTRTQDVGVKVLAQVSDSDISNVVIASNVIRNQVADGIVVQTSGSGSVTGALVVGNSSAGNAQLGFRFVEGGVAAISRLSIFGNSGGCNGRSDLRLQVEDSYVGSNVLDTTAFAGTKSASPGSAFGKDCGDRGSVGMVPVRVGGSRKLTPFQNQPIGVIGAEDEETGHPQCDASQRGRLWFQIGDKGTMDRVHVCAKDSADVFAWRQLY